MKEKSIYETLGCSQMNRYVKQSETLYTKYVKDNRKLANKRMAQFKHDWQKTTTLSLTAKFGMGTELVKVDGTNIDKLVLMFREQVLIDAMLDDIDMITKDHRLCVPDDLVIP